MWLKGWPGGEGDCEDKKRSNVGKGVGAPPG
jgi:hypothetical protein